MKEIFVRYVEPFQSYALPTDGRSAKFDVIPANFLRGGLKKSKVDFKA